jgi:hypothetical protein
MTRPCSPEEVHLEAPDSPLTKRPGVLGRVKGALAALGGGAALDPPSARQESAVTGESGGANPRGSPLLAKRRHSVRMPVGARQLRDPRVDLFWRAQVGLFW